MPSQSNAQRLAIVPDTEDFNSEPIAPAATAEPVVCSFCFGTGMEVMEGKNNNSCRLCTLSSRFSGLRR